MCLITVQSLSDDSFPYTDFFMARRIQRVRQRHDRMGRWPDRLRSRGLPRSRILLVYRPAGGCAVCGFPSLARGGEPRRNDWMGVHGEQQSRDTCTFTFSLSVLGIRLTSQQDVKATERDTMISGDLATLPTNPAWVWAVICISLGFALLIA